MAIVIRSDGEEFSKSIRIEWKGVSPTDENGRKIVENDDGILILLTMRLQTPSLRNE